MSCLQAGWPFAFAKLWWFSIHKSHWQDGDTWNKWISYFLSDFQAHRKSFVQSLDMALVLLTLVLLIHMVLVVIFKALNDLGPTYLWEWLSHYVPQRASCFGDQNLLVTPGLKDICLSTTRVRAFLILAWPGRTPYQWYLCPVGPILRDCTLV